MPVVQVAGMEQAHAPCKSIRKEMPIGGAEGLIRIFSSRRHPLFM